MAIQIDEWENITPDQIKKLFKKYADFIEVKDIEFGDEKWGAKEHEIYVTIETYDMTGEIDKRHRKSLEEGYDKIARELKADWDYHHADLKQIKFMFDVAE